MGPIVTINEKSEHGEIAKPSTRRRYRGPQPSTSRLRRLQPDVEIRWRQNRFSHFPDAINSPCHLQHFQLNQFGMKQLSLYPSFRFVISPTSAVIFRSGIHSVRSYTGSFVAQLLNSISILTRANFLGVKLALLRAQNLVPIFLASRPS
ncbi:hypothetical protein MPTK2_3g16230 [Marchantia polymorpha subsp. ruderalis]